MRRVACLVPILTLAWSAPLAAQSAPDPTAPLVASGCTGCHSLDGAPNQGPTFQGLYGSHRGVYRDGERVTVVADDDYLRRSIATPDLEIADGYDPGFMPHVSRDDAEFDALVAALAAVPSSTTPASGTWWPLCLGLFLFVFGHLALSSAPLRGPIVARIGEKGFSGLYSLVAFAGVGLVVWGYPLASYYLIFEPPTWTRWIPNLIVPIAFVLMVAGFTTPGPTSVGQADRAGAGPRGIHRITRHPALWGFALWGLAHVPPNADLKSSLLFLGVAFLAFAGMVHIDLRRAARPDDHAWEQYEKQTSVFPFVAIAAGRTSLVWKEIGIWRVLAGLLAWAAMLHLHRLVIGVSALP
ncbi:MAG: hypothetical protein K1X94_14890 [Sandaracinaceae bacterium]|nr:hypothetical protein [Sandaracinaceae bacterium]